MTSELRPAKCIECGNDFQYTIWIRDGKERPPANTTVCTECIKRKEEAALKERLEKEYIETLDDVEAMWFGEASDSQPEFMMDRLLEIVGADKTVWDSFDRKLQPKAFDAIRNFSGKSIILSSPDIYGVGKTHLVCCLLHHLVYTTEKVKTNTEGRIIKRYKCPVFMTSETKILARIKNTYNQHYEGETEDTIYKNLIETGLLIIDDVGKVRPRDLSFLQGVYYRIIDERYGNNDPIIITTNLSPAELEKHIGGASADRLREMCGKNNIIVMTGKSYRR